MTDLLIRDVPDDVLAAIDANAKRMGLSRTEYLRRALARQRTVGEVAVADLSRFADSFADLLDPQVIDRARGPRLGERARE